MCLMFQFCILLFLFIPKVLTDFDSDLETIAASFQYYNPECAFNYSELTSKTVNYFPKDCFEIYGLVTLNSNLDLSISQLKDVFKGVSRINGGLRIENTKLETLSFFPDEDEYTSNYVVCPDFGTIIANNKKLINIDVFKTLAIYGNGQSLGPFQFVNNTKADATNLCNMGHFPNHIDMVVDGNLKDCGCHYFQLYPNSSKASCIDLYGGLSFSNISNPSTIYDLSQIKRLGGKITIQWSNFRNLSFLSSLQTIKTIGPYDHIELFLNLHDNPLMTRLAFPKVTSLENTQSGAIQINIENLHPDFCLTVQEIIFLMNAFTTFENLHAKICDYQGETIEGSKFCVFKNMTSLDSGCVHLYGDLVIGPGDEGQVSKLKEVKGVIGSVIVNSTSLADLSFFGNSFYFVALNESLPAVQLIGNKNLKSFNVSQHLDIWTNRNRYCVIQGNHPDLVKSSCNFFKPYITNMTYLGDQCGHIYYDANNRTIGIENGSSVGTPECTFNYSEVTSKTIKFFPKRCDYYCGLINLNENLDLTPTQLKEVFKNMRWLSGGLWIKNTNLKNLNFLVELDIDYSETYIQCWGFGTYIINNTELINLRVFEQLKMFDFGVIGRLEFVNNTKADASGLCENAFLKDSMDLVVDGNLRDCGCYYHQLAPNSLKVNCTELYQLSLSNVSDPTGVYDLSKVERIHGFLSIEISNYQNLSFLFSLKTIKIVGSYDDFKIVFNLRNNPQMTRLALPSLINLENIEFSPLIINFENLHPDFCLTVQELVLFMNLYRTFDNLHAKVCEYNGEPIVQSKLCVFKNMALLEEDCIRIYGNLVVEASDEGHVDKLKEVVGVIGSVTIRSTSIDSLSFMGKMRYVVSLHDTLPAVALLDNKNLKTLEGLSEYLDIWTNQNRYCVIQGNHPDLIKSPDSCKLFKPFLDVRNMTYLGDQCAPECTFNHSELTSKTVKFFPKHSCYDHCGLITLNENLDLTETQLKKVFKNVKWLSGSLRIENTKLKNLNFLVDYNDYDGTVIQCAHFGTSIINNTELVNIRAFEKLGVWGRVNGYGNGPFKFINNTKADASWLCDSYLYKDNMDLIVEGNLKDCGCYYHHLAPHSPKANCTDLYGLSLSNISDPSSIYDLSKVERIHGDFLIESSNFENMSFLTKLNNITTAGPFENFKRVLNFKDNPLMTRLAFPCLIYFENVEYSPLVINFENLHPDFCLTVQELVFFMNLYRTIDNLHAKVCEYNGGPIEQSKLCVFKNMASLDSDCIRVYGELVVGAGDERYVDKLKEVVGVIGSVTIRATNLDSLSFIGKIRYIVSLHDTLPAVALIDNKNLKTLEGLSEYLDIWTNDNRYCVIQGNHPDLIKSPDFCKLFKPFLDVRNMTYVGDQCGEAYIDVNNETKRASSESRHHGYLMACVLLLTLFIL